ncbi:MAG TPA: hypothetical protein VN761_02310 [Candidatus Polarisedimenticolia bacterium]|nr:hypothetical protein [Candidatus Polarisedimenticolia bacterium]
MTKRTTILILSLSILALLLMRAARANRAFNRHPKWWQLLVGAAAVIVVVLIILNPELLGLGFFGDTAFVDLLLLAASFQLETVVKQASRFCVSAVQKFIGHHH